MDLNNKVAIVTGGSSGLGEATVKAYLEKGAKVAIFDMNPSQDKTLSVKYADNLMFRSVDVTDENAVSQALNDVCETFGPIYICNNFAGIAPGEKVYGKKGAHRLELFQNVININLVGTFNVSRLVAEKMAHNQPINSDGGRGVIINTASVAAFEGQMGQSAYSASKAGVVGMTLPMARDLAAVGIRVNCLAPGIIHTPLFDNFSEEVIDSLSESVVYPKRLGAPSEVAALSVFIVENDYLNGETIRLDGAIRMQPR